MGNSAAVDNARGSMAWPKTAISVGDYSLSCFAITAPILSAVLPEQLIKPVSVVDDLFYQQTSFFADQSERMDSQRDLEALRSLLPKKK